MYVYISFFARELLSRGSIDSAKHLHSPGEQLHSLAGSFGYVAPEVLNKTGHSKAVDIWSTG
jgi:serine/threonine protein kinase